MREILFRGQRFSDLNEPYSNEWVEGFYYQLGSQHYIRKDIHIWEVDHKTVGQFTGLTDKNGVKIFDGDIFKRIDNKDTFLVVWEKDCYLSRTIYDNWIKSNILNRNNDVSLNFMTTFQIEVIGNIHSNPELLNS